MCGNLSLLATYSQLFQWRFSAPYRCIGTDYKTRYLRKDGRKDRSERKKLLDDIKEKRGYWKLKEQALNRSLWRTRFGRGYGPVVGQTTK